MNRSSYGIESRERIARLKTAAEIQLSGDNGYNNILIMAGGAGSGKSFSLQNYIGIKNPKIVEPDVLKSAVFRIKAWKNEAISQGIISESDDVKSLDNAEIAYKLHCFFWNWKNAEGKSLRERYQYQQFWSRKQKDMNLEDVAPENSKFWKMSDKEKDAFVDKMSSMTEELRDEKNITAQLMSNDRKPNLVFDLMCSDKSQLAEISKYAQEAGYSPSNIHIVWILTPLKIAIERNKKRGRQVPEEQMKIIHKTVANHMTSILNAGQNLKQYMDGDFWICFNSTELDMSNYGGKVKKYIDKKTKKKYDGIEVETAVGKRILKVNSSDAMLQESNLPKMKKNEKTKELEVDTDENGNVKHNAVVLHANFFCLKKQGSSLESIDKIDKAIYEKIKNYIPEDAEFSSDYQGEYKEGSASGRTGSMKTNLRLAHELIRIARRLVIEQPMSPF